MNTLLDKHWHLAESDYEVALTELEFSILRVSAAFERWRSDCMACCAGLSLSGSDTAVLHVIRMHNRPKSISEIGRLLNRDDQANLQYGIRKLVKAGVIEKAGVGESKKDVTYAVTDFGRDITDRFAEFRKELLLTLTRSITTEDSLDDIARVLTLMSGMYDQASCIAAAHRVAP